ncbi:hypothetical protein CFAM422_004409 [Trichoderma lentiforme]|uniref:Uncharacterized protein n=1 Tax=Trichoderma lentiforme TaxID=1567552 RepID=A0A9P5CGJ8_9HYPO|nr:hypothetical protein CFAM422_004409 [Trichoderma lentiforme]
MEFSLIGCSHRLSNVEDNEETPLLSGRDIRSRTLAWQHDNAFIRLPSQLAITIWQFVRLFIRLLSQMPFYIWQFVRLFVRLLPEEFVLVHYLLLVWCLATIAVCGALAMEIKEGRFNILLIILCSLSMISLAIAFSFRNDWR